MGQDENKIQLQRIRSETYKSACVQEFEGKSSMKGPNNSRSCGFWERKCAILEEEVLIRKDAEDELEIQLNEERQNWEGKKMELQHKLDMMSSKHVNNNMTKEKLDDDKNIVAIEQDLREEKKTRKLHEHIIREQ